MFAKLSKKGQVTIPADVRRQLKLRPGARVRFQVGNDSVEILPIEGGFESLKGSVKVDTKQNFKSARHKAMEKVCRERTTYHRR